MTVKIINTVYGWNDNGHIRPTLPGGECDVSDEEAGRLIGMGVAASDDGSDTSGPEPDQDPEPDDDGDGSGGNDGEDGADAVAYSVDMKASELEAIMESYGIAVAPKMTKAEMVEALDEYFGGDDESPPDLTSEDVVGA